MKIVYVFLQLDTTLKVLKPLLVPIMEEKKGTLPAPLFLSDKPNGYSLSRFILLLGLFFFKTGFILANKSAKLGIVIFFAV